MNLPGLPLISKIWIQTLWQILGMTNACNGNTSKRRLHLFSNVPCFSCSWQSEANKGPKLGSAKTEMKNTDSLPSDPVWALICSTGGTKDIIPKLKRTYILSAVFLYLHYLKVSICIFNRKWQSRKKSMILGFFLIVLVETCVLQNAPIHFEKNWEQNLLPRRKSWMLRLLFSTSLSVLVALIGSEILFSRNASAFGTLQGL